MQITLKIGQISRNLKKSNNTLWVVNVLFSCLIYLLQQFSLLLDCCAITFEWNTKHLSMTFWFHLQRKQLLSLPSPRLRFAVHRFEDHTQLFNFPNLRHKQCALLPDSMESMWPPEQKSLFFFFYAPPTGVTVSRRSGALSGKPPLGPGTLLHLKQRERERDDWRAHSSLVMTALHCFKFDFKFDNLFLIYFGCFITFCCLFHSVSAGCDV